MKPNINPSQRKIGTRQELIAIIFPFLSAVTMQAPHPPSLHINFVPVKWAYSRKNVFNVVAAGMSSDTLITKNALIKL